MVQNLWGDWPQKVARALDAVNLTPEEKEILAKAQMIRAAHIARMKEVIAQLEKEES